ncbi:MAG: acyl-CoA/acyl-ACP dehydrogenase [Deltaproteobacteria bacterium]|nr:acyl-CoA/acyl-ACP dehydrogenase [Deltaproteobacteria bacterium]
MSIADELLPFGFTEGAKLPSGVLEEIREAARLAREFNRDVVRPRAHDLDRLVQGQPEHLPWDLVKAAGDRGFYSLWLPRAFGGGGYGPLSMLAFSEELASECLGVGNLIGAHYVGIALISATFNMRVLRRVCEDVVAGELAGKPRLVSTAITEPDAGTDMEDVDLLDRGRVGCRAERAEGGYRLSGTKMFISNGHLSAWHVVTGYSNLAKPSESVVIAAVPSSSKGFSLGRIERKMGQNACPASVLNFDSCFVPDELICLEPSRHAGPIPYRQVCEMLSDDVLAMSRPGVAIMAAGAAKGAYRAAFEHCVKTRVDGVPLASLEWVQTRLAEMWKNVKLGEYCAWEAGLRASSRGPFRTMQQPLAYWLLKLLPAAIAAPLLSHPSGRAKMLADRAALRRSGADREYGSYSSLAKFAATDLAVDSCRIALELMGHAGGRGDGRVEKILRDVRLTQIYEGTNQLNRLNLFKQGLGHGAPGVSVFGEGSSC